MTATKASKPVAETPPEDSFWKRYSPHHEFPVAGAVSLFLHGGVVVAMIVTGLGLLWSSASESQKPAKMDVVMVEGGGTGFEGGGGEAGLPGPSTASKTEIALNPMDPPEIGSATPKQNDSFTPSPVLEVPTIGANENISDDPLAELAKLAKETQAQIDAKMKADKIAKAGNTTGGTDSPKGTGGKGGGGKDVGLGSKTGPGVGIGGLGGRKLTRPEIFSRRWRFNLSGDPAKHAEKLVQMGVVIAVPQTGEDYLVARDLKRRPVEFIKEDMSPYKNAVKWQNDLATSLQGLARELQMPAVPQRIFMLLPKDREEAMAEAEASYARSQRRNVAAIQETWFDFRLRNGVYEPFVVSQK